MYDSPQEVAEAFLSSLTETIEGADAEDGHSPGEQQKRKIVLDPSGSMNIYLVLDGSDSIGSSNFTGAKRCLTNLIEKVDQSSPPFEMRGPYLDPTALTRLVSCVPRSFGSRSCCPPASSLSQQEC